MNEWMENVLLRMQAQSEKKVDVTNACLELVNLYRAEKPLSALAFALKAKRMSGHDSELNPLLSAVERLRQTELQADPQGCCRLGLELSSYPEDQTDIRKAILYLKTAADSEGASCAGSAALALADLLSSLGGRSEEAYHYYRKAESLGFYDILPPPHKTNHTEAVA